LTINIEAISTRKTKVSEMEKNIQDLLRKKMSIISEVSSHDSFSPEASQSKINALSNHIDTASKQCAHESKRISDLEEKIANISKETCGPLVFWKYLSSEQTKNREHISILRKEIEKSKDSITKLQNEIKSKSKDLSVEKSTYEKRTKFDVKRARNELDELATSVSKIERSLEAEKLDLFRLEEKISPHIKARDEIISDIRKYDSDLLLAEKYNSALDKASDNARARRDIHKQCEDYFKEGRPNKVIDEISSKKNRSLRDLKKIERRIADETRKHEMEIDSIIIDGNNACYSSSSDFIGLSAVRTLAQHLSKRFKVTVVFDASIRKLLKASTQDIQKNLGREISTYVAPSKNAADEYILKLAEGCDRSYIITNDRYSEWHDYDAVREARAINFLISSDKIIVNDLDVSIPF
jgi:hypothetical protein